MDFLHTTSLTISVLYLIIGIIGLYYGADWLVKGSISTALKLGIAPVIIGLTVVAFGTSSPELLVSFNAGRLGNADIALGNIIGSNIANIALILGAASLIRPIVLNIRSVKFDLIFMLVVSVAFSYIVLDRNLDTLDGILCLVGIAVYIGIKLYQVLKKKDPELVADATGEVDQDSMNMTWARAITLIILGIVILAVSSEVFINGAVTVATFMGVSNVVIGLTIVAFGTSLPELATSVVAAVKNQGDVSIGNVIGSNIFNLLFILGFTATLFPISTGDINVIDLIVMIATSLLIIPMAWMGGKITRPEAGFLLLVYFGYVYYLYTLHA
jgi:cation:H+ antiporter